MDAFVLPGLALAVVVLVIASTRAVYRRKSVAGKPAREGSAASEAEAAPGKPRDVHNPGLRHQP